jgi:uncharacterized protein YqgV (UPF0045/DUF77 family)
VPGVFLDRVTGLKCGVLESSNRYSSGVTVIAPVPWQVSRTELAAAVTAAETRLRQNYAEILELVSALDSRGVATEFGYPNTAGLLVHLLRISRTEARHRIAQAADLHPQTTPTGSVIEAVLPRTAAALAQGVVGVGHVEVIRTTFLVRSTRQRLPRTSPGAVAAGRPDPDGQPPAAVFHPPQTDPQERVDSRIRQ